MNTETNRYHYRVDWFDARHQLRSMWFEKWEDAVDEAMRHSQGTVWKV